MGLGYAVLVLGFEVSGLGFEVFGGLKKRPPRLPLPYGTFASSCVWASRFWGCLMRPLRRGASGLRGFGTALRDFCVVVRLGFEVMGLPYETFAPRLVWASRFRGYLARFLRRGASGLRGFGAALRDFCVVARLGFEVSGLPYETFAPWRVWASRFQGCLTGLLRFGASGLRGLGAALRDFCVATGLGFEVSGLPCKTFALWCAWASRCWGCLTRLLRRDWSGLRGFGATLRDFCAVARLGFEVLGLPYRTFASSGHKAPPPVTGLGLVVSLLGFTVLGLGFVVLGLGFVACATRRRL